MVRVSDAMAQLGSAQKSSSGAAAYSRYVNRPLGRILAAVAYAVGLAPNTVTLVSAAVTYSGIAVIALVRPSVWSSIAITALLVIGYALDSADGQVARLQKRSSLNGEWLDHMADVLKIATIHTAVLISWFRFFDLPKSWLLVPILFQVVASVFFFGIVLTDLLRRISVGTSTSTSTSTSGVNRFRMSPFYSLAVIPSDYGFLCLVFLTLWSRTVFVSIYSTLAFANALILCLAGARWFRSIRSLGERV